MSMLFFISILRDVSSISPGPDSSVLGSHSKALSKDADTPLSRAATEDAAAGGSALPPSCIRVIEFDRLSGPSAEVGTTLLTAGLLAEAALFRSDATSPAATPWSCKEKDGYVESVSEGLLT